jgi:hypothetical protein
MAGLTLGFQSVTAGDNHSVPPVELALLTSTPAKV